jgi:hypothetical protein
LDERELVDNQDEVAAAIVVWGSDSEGINASFWQTAQVATNSAT